MSKTTLKNVASFRENPVTLETDKKVNLIYGLNGTGKTTFSDFLYFREKEPKFKDCKLEGVGDKKILVYNQSFIQDNFYSKDELKGIFTLSKSNKEAEVAINKANEEKKKQEIGKTEQETNIENIENEKKQKLNIIKNDVWKIKKEYTGDDRVLAFCLDKLQTKDLLFNHIRRIQKTEKESDETTDKLKQEIQSISGENAQNYDELKNISLNLEHIEKNTIFSEVIIGNEDSPVAGLIKTLNNSDWVKQGIDYLPNGKDASTEQCPFCQEETITKQIVQNIRSYFDETYEQKIAEIRQLKEQYKQASFPTVEDYVDCPLMEGNKNEFEKIHAKINQHIGENRLKIKSKLKEPSQKIILTNTKNELNELNNFIDKINQKILIHNKKIHNKKQTEENIKNKFWQIMRWEYDDKISSYNKETDQENREIEKLKNNIAEINKEIKNQINEIQNQQKNMVNEVAAQHINTGLIGLGIEEFYVQNHQKNSYRIVREEKLNRQFSTLSEGEKMIISFLYFMELCKGRESEEEVERDKIVIIDDPISSLSHIYIFNVSQWIKQHFLNENYKEIFVLTHNLYFFHELTKDDSENHNNRNFFRLTKSSDKGTQIQIMKKNEINNEYESYWQVIADHGNGKASDSLLANSMRNILEHFFGFIDKEKLSKVLQNLGTDKEFTPFLRYINRESHSDAINITDNKEINSELFKKYFKDVFNESGYEKHYKKMMQQEQ